MTIQETIQSFIDQHKCSTTVERILDQIKKETPHQKFPNLTGETHFVRLYHPLFMRQEVFLGNALFNAFLGLQAQRALNQAPETYSLPVFQDLESYYFLIHTTRPIEELQNRVLNAWVDGLEDLYFSEPTDEEEESDFVEAGYFGKFSTMLKNYFKSNIQPFPLMIVPETYAEKLELKIRQYLIQKLDSGEWQQEVANFTANFSYFYGQTSGGTGDVQSCPNFLRRLVEEYQVIEAEEMNLAFQLPSGTNYQDGETKTLIQQKLFAKGEIPAFYPEKLKQVFQKALDHFAASIEQNKVKSEWLFRYHREKGVFLNLTPQFLVNYLVSGATFAGRPFVAVNHREMKESCLVCGYHSAQLAGATIIASDSFSKFHNHSLNRGSTEKRICYNCAMYAYLNVKFSGSKGAGMGQVPRNGNLVFHYGTYTNEEVSDLLVRFRDQMEFLKSVGSNDWNSEVHEELFLDEEISEEQLYSLSAMFRRHDGMDATILPIHFGEQKLIIFALPGMQEDVQKRFHQNWYATMNMLSWLYKLGKKEGDYYYLSVPQSKHLGSKTSHLYVNGNVFAAEEQIILHGYYQMIVPALSSSRQRGGFEHEMLTAEHLQRDPLGKFSHELRGWLADGRLSVKRQKDMGELLSAIYKIMNEEGKDVENNDRMTEKHPKNDKEKLDLLTNQLYYTLDMLGLMPLTMSEKPHSFEKWAREFIRQLKREGTSVTMVFDIWQNRLLRNAMYPSSEKSSLSEDVRKKRMEVLGAFKHMCLEQEYEPLLHTYTNQLLTSLLARAFAYMYPVLSLCRTYTEKHLEKEECFKETYVEKHFETDVQDEFAKLQEKHLATQDHLRWAKDHILMHSHYYKKFKIKELTV